MPGQVGIAMGRPLRLLVLCLCLLLSLALLAWALQVRHAGLAAGVLAFVLAVMAGLRLRGNAPGFTRREKRRAFGRLH